MWMKIFYGIFSIMIIICRTEFFKHLFLDGDEIFMLVASKISMWLWMGKIFSMIQNAQRLCLNISRFMW